MANFDAVSHEIETIYRRLESISSRLTALERLQVPPAEPEKLTVQESSPTKPAPERPPVEVPPKAPVKTLGSPYKPTANADEEFIAATVVPRQEHLSGAATIERQRQHEQSWETLIGGRIFTWVGGILLTLAGAFFIVWSWRYLQTPPWLKVSVLHLLGLAGIGAGAFLNRKKLSTHAQVLYGVGIFVLYASALAMTHLYRIGGDLREVIGFLDGTLITVVAIFVAVRLRSFGIVLLGAFGGYLTPFITMVSGGDDSVVFSYLALLNLALLWSGHLGRWAFLKPMAWGVTALIFLGWLLFGVFNSSVVATAMLCLHATIFVASTTLPHYGYRRPSEPLGNLVMMLSSTGLLAGLAIIHELSLVKLLIPASILAAIHGQLFWMGHLLSAKDRLPRLHLALATFFLTVGITCFFHEQASYWSTIWALEGFALALVGFAYRDRQLVVSAAVVFALSLVRLTTSEFLLPREFLSVFDSRFVSWLFVGLCTIAAGSGRWWMPNLLRSNTDPSAAVESTLNVLAGLFLAVGFVQTMAASAFQFERPEWPLLIWVFQVAGVWYFGISRDIRHVRIYAAALALTMVCGVGFIWGFGVVDHAAGNHDHLSRLAGLVLAVLFLLAGNVYRRREINDLVGDWKLHPLFALLGNGALLFLCSIEIYKYFHPRGIGHIGEGELATYSVAWGAYASAMIVLGLVYRYREYRVFGIVLFALVIGKVFLVDLASFELIVRVVALFILGMLLLGVSYLYQRLNISDEPDKPEVRTAES